MTIHLIPVPPGWSIEQAWEAISRGDTLLYPAGVEPLWANVETDENDRFVRILDIEEE